MNNNPSFFGHIRLWIARHKKTFWLMVIIVIVGGYYIYRRSKAAGAIPQYVVSVARFGSITETVSGTGQVAASNQLDVKSQVSGTILAINARVGQSVKAGDLLATLDSTNAALDLENARLAMAKLVEPAKDGDLTNAKNNVNKAYDDAYNAVSNTFLDLPPVMTGMKDLLYSQTGFLSDQKSTFLNTSARSYRDTAATTFDQAANTYQTVLREFQGITRGSDTVTLDKIFTETSAMVRQVAQAVTAAQNAVTFITHSQPDYNTSQASSASTNTSTWGNSMNSDVSSILSSQNSISSSKTTLQNLIDGADSLDIQTQQLSLKQKQQTYEQYFIRAPFDGIVGRIPVNRYDQASGGTVIATVVGTQKVVTIALDEVDAAKVSEGQPVNITFDAIDGLNATGTVTQVDQVGTVSSGVVSYNVKISINTVDERIKPGMSVSASIVTNSLSNVLIVPSSAVKTSGNSKYVEVFDSIATSSLVSAGTATNITGTTRTFGGNGFRNASSTRNFAASSTPGFASSTRTFGGSFSGTNITATRSQTISSAVAPRQVPVTIGLADDTNTQITGGLRPGSYVVTRTISSGSQTTTAPSILSSFGGNRGAGGNATRITTGAVRPN